MSCGDKNNNVREVLDGWNNGYPSTDASTKEYIKSLSNNKNDSYDKIVRNVFSDSLAVVDEILNPNPNNNNPVIEDKNSMFVKKDAGAIMGDDNSSILNNKEFKYFNSLKFDEIQKARHYNQGGIEVVDFIAAHNLDFFLGNVVKYVCRSPHKGEELKDLKKAKYYIEHKIKQLENK